MTHLFRFCTLLLLIIGISSCRSTPKVKDNSDGLYSFYTDSADIRVVLQAFPHKFAPTSDAFLTSWWDDSHISAQEIRFGNYRLDKAHDFSKKFELEDGVLNGKYNELWMDGQLLSDSVYVVQPLRALGIKGREGSDSLYTFSWKPDSSTEHIWLQLVHYKSEGDTLFNEIPPMTITTEDDGLYVLERSNLKGLKFEVNGVNLIRTKNSSFTDPLGRKVLVGSTSSCSVRVNLE